MRKVIRKVAAVTMCSTLVVTSSGAVALAKEPIKFIITEGKKSSKVVENEVAAKDVLYVTSEMVNAKGTLEIKKGNWDRIVISRDVNAKKVVLNGIAAKEVVIESGTDCVFEMKNSVVGSVEVVAPELEVIDLAKIKELLSSGMSASEVARLQRAYFKAKNEITNLQPKIVVQKGTEINTVKISSNAQFDFKSDKVEKVEITLTSNQERFNIGLNGFAGAVSVAENKDKKDNTKSFLNLELKNSEVKELVLSGSEKSAYTINSKGKSKVGNLEVKGSSNISLGVATEAIKVAKDAVNVALKIYSEVKNVVVEGSKNKITLADSAKVEYAEIKGDDTQIHGSGNLGFAEITGNGANVSVPGTNVNGNNNSTPPVTEDNTPSRPSTPSSPTSTPSKPTGTPSEPTGKPTGTPSEPTGTPTDTPSEPTGKPTGTPSEPTGTPTGTPSEPTGKPENPEEPSVEVTEDDFVYYENEDGTITISDFTNEEATSVIIPETINGLTVTAIGEWAFEYCENIKEIILPNTVKEIGYDAFYACVSLENIVLSNTLEKIGSRAFSDCKKLAQIVIPESVVIMEDNIFQGCISLKELYIPKNVTSFNGYSVESPYFYTMWDCTSLESIIVAEENKTFTSKDGVLYSKEVDILLYVPDAYVGELVIPETVKEIESMALVDCYKMTKLVIPSGFVGGDGYPFEADGLQSLQEIVVEEGNEYYYSEKGLLFDINGQLVKVPAKAIPTVYEIPSKLANGIEVWHINSEAFNDCSELTSVTLSATIEDISQCFRNCASLTEIKVVDENPYYTSIDGVLFSKDGKTLSAFPCNYATTTYVVAEGVDTIGFSAFENCFALKSISLPNTLEYIEEGAFAACVNLTEVTVPDSVVVLGNSAFYNCRNLVSIELSKNLKFIGSGTFGNCRKLEAIKIPATVTEIWSSAFDNCRSLTKVVLPEGITEIASSLFNGCKNLVSVTIPNSVTKIGSNAFSGCSALTEIHLPDGVTEIGSSAFFTCSGLIEFIIPSGVTVIESTTFYYCTGLKEIVIPDSVKEIKYNAFYRCEALEKIVISSSVQQMGSGIFSGSSKVVIYTPEGSVADKYAAENKIQVVHIEDTYVPTPVLPEHSMFKFEFDLNNNLVIKALKNNNQLLPSININKDMVDGYKVVGIGEGVFKECKIASGAAITIGKDVTIGKEAFANLKVQVASGSAITVATNAAITIKLEDGVTFDKTSFENSVTRIIFDVSKTIRKELEAILKENAWNWEFK